jgi:hypothetical protein
MAARAFSGQATASYSVHVCVRRPTRSQLREWEGNPDAGWLEVEWPAGLEMVDSWFGFEEFCAHGYCARLDFDPATTPADTIVARLEAIPQILRAAIEDEEQ